MNAEGGRGGMAEGSFIQSGSAGVESYEGATSLAQRTCVGLEVWLEVYEGP